MKISVDLTINRVSDSEYEVIESGALLADLFVSEIDGCHELAATIYELFIDQTTGLPNETHMTLYGSTVKSVLRNFVERVAFVRISEGFDYLDNNGRTEQEADEHV